MESAATFLASLPERVHAIVARRAAATPTAPALAEAGRSLGYRELQALVDSLAQRLAAAGLRAGDRLLLVGENSIAMAAGIFAASALDAWAVPVNARLSPRELDAIREHCRPRRSLFTVAASPDASAHAERYGAAAETLRDGSRIALGPLDTACIAEAVSTDPAHQVAALLYTSGTTGQPKGVMLCHRNLAFIATLSARLRELSAADRVYGVLPISHVFGLASVLFGTLSAGASLVLEPRFSPEKLARALAEDGITVMQGVPAMYARLLELAGCGALRLTAPWLRFLYAGGAPLDASLKAAVESAFGKPLHNGYGMTESSPTIAQTRPGAPRSDTSVGLPIPHVEVRLVGPQGEEAAAGEAGELWVRGPNVMLGYYRDPALTAATVKPGGWLATGDLARRGEDGALYLVGRAKELIIRSGFNVYPVEVESVLNSHPAVTQSAVVGRTVPGNEEVVAFVEVRPGARVTPRELADWAAQRLTAYKRPAEIVIVDQLPAAATGKVLKHRLRELAGAARPPGDASAGV